jgi:ferredoxin
MTIKRVWIEEGCISCNLCMDLCPEVFAVPPGGTSQIVKGHEKRLADGRIQEKVSEAAENCPVEVIKHSA